MSADEELRRLQRKAYGRAGGLTAEDARRLRDLEQAHAAIVREVSLPIPAARETIPRMTSPAPTPAPDGRAESEPALEELLGPGPEDADAAAKDSADAREPAAAPGTRAVLRR
ncbi:MAG: hypothetical protein IJG47_06275, partial [Microbacterium sp.]|nr:hypothetical protein [Microbacterium sp.]